MREDEAQLVLLVRAVEEVDGEGRILSAHDRAGASTRAHGAPAGGAADASGDGAPAAAPDDRADAEAFLARRARDLAERLGERMPALREILASTRLGSTLAPTVAVVALAVGLFSNALGPERRINVLSLPLVAILAWNVAVYLALAVLALRSRAARGGPRVPRTGAPRATRLVEWFLGRAWVAPARRRLAGAPVLASALARFLVLWRPAGAGLVALRVERMLHLGALALAAGAVGGMYLRGLAFAYEATWESTFLGPGQVAAFLRVLLGPALLLLGRPLPDVAAIAAPRSGWAGEWIHLWALSTVIVVIAPRALLAWSAARRASSRAADLRLELGDGYFRRLLAPRSGDRVQVVVRPYSVHPGPRERDVLAAVLHDVFGARAEVAFADPVDYGDPLDASVDPREAAPDPDPGGAPPGRSPEPRPDDGARRCDVVLFALAQSPETEVHGEAMARLREGAGPGRQVLALVDGAGFRARLGAGARLDERRRAWDRVARDAGLTVVHVDLGRPAPDDELAALGAALFPPARQGAP